MRLPWRQVLLDDVAIETSLTGDESRTLRLLAQGQSVLEIGSAYGFSTCVMGRVAQYVIAVDPHEGYGSLPDSWEVFNFNLARFGLVDSVKPVRRPSKDVFPVLLMLRVKFDLVFIDGSHQRFDVESDIRAALDLIDEDGVIAIHDYGEESCPGVKQAVDDVFGWGAGGVTPLGNSRIVDTLFIFGGDR